MEAWLNPTQLVGTPQRPSQARRAQFARSPATSIVPMQKRQRTPSPTPMSPSTDGNPATPTKQRRIEGASVDATRTRPTTPALTASQRAARQAEIERGLTEAKKTARLASIQEALSAVQGSSQANAPSGSSPTSSRILPPTSRGGSSRVRTSEDTIQLPGQQVSDLPRSLFPSPVSHNPTILRGPPRPPQSSQSDAGYSITSEIEAAEFDDLEDKAIQTDPVDDEESIIEEFWNTPPAHSVIGSPVAYPSSPGKLGDFGTGTSHEEMSRVPKAESGRGSWLPAPRQTQGRGRTPRVSTPGGNEGGMLLTPPGTSQRDYESAGQWGRYPRQQSPSPSPSPTKGKGRELPRSESASTSRSQWQMIQDDPENPFHERAAALRAGSPTTSVLSGAESMYESAGLLSGPFSADTVAAQIASLTDIPEYIRKLERRQRAAMNSAEIKSRRIAQLEEEVQRLRNEKRALEETVAALQVRR
ncbi:hypothetical protein L226DRAFT_86772 [Lentinus tigrinus ALCF2SS1-7]|uniref:uncharacterized protein n=1 Tax=Lentinus tigrinus ALCF2SS1-7 TaxID=1328758 RepID=UPI0011661056|nr:hypothetical protein L226DRAFT_86772 [Lentinus tigrinus ALCF2SS1-7]